MASWICKQAGVLNSLVLRYPCFMHRLRAFLGSPIFVPFVASVVFLMLWFWFVKTVPTSWNDASRLATMESLVEGRGWDISNSMFMSGFDKIRVQGRYLSDKTPLFSLLGTAVYAGLHAIGLNFAEHLEWIHPILVFFLCALPALGILFLADHWLRLQGGGSQETEVRAWVLVAVLFGNLVLPYTVILNSHVLAAFGILATFCLLTVPGEPKTRGSGGGPLRRSWRWLRTVFGVEGLAGLLAGLAAASDHPALWLALALGVFAWRRGRVLPYAVGLAVPLVATALIYRGVSGAWAPFALQLQGYRFPGSRQPESLLFGGMAGWNPLDSIEFLWTASFGAKGVFSHSIAVLVGLLAFWRSRRFEFAVVLGAVAWTVAIFAKGPVMAYGGACYGFRYMIFWMPLVTLFTFEWLRSPVLAAWVKSAIVVSVVTSVAGIQAPWLMASDGSFDYVHAFKKEASAERAVAEFRKRILTEEAMLRERYSIGHEPGDMFRLAELRMGAGDFDRALGYLYLLRDRHPEYRQWHCLAARIFSRNLVYHEDLFQRHSITCSSSVGGQSPGQPR